MDNQGIVEGYYIEKENLSVKNDVFSDKLKIRNSNLELYRIFCMFFIVLHHFVIHCLDVNAELGNGINKYLTDILSFGGKIGVNGFVLISGYFMADSKYTIKKHLKMEGEIWFYSSVALMISSLILGIDSIGGLAAVLKALLPVFLNQYWYATSFIALMILSPFLNIAVHKIKENQYKKLLIILFVLCSIIPASVSCELSTTLTWFVFLYLLAAYTKLYTDVVYDKAIRHATISLIGIACLWCSSIIINCLGIYFENSKILSHSRHFMSMKGVIVLVISYEMFMSFLCKKRFYNSIINKIASAVFGVYLIHDNEYIRVLLWGNMIKYIDWDNPADLVFYSLSCTVFVYLLCTLIDLVRQHTVEKLWLKFINKYEEYVIKKIVPIIYNIYVCLKNKYNYFIR